MPLNKSMLWGIESTEILQYWNANSLAQVFDTAQGSRFNAALVYSEVIEKVLRHLYA